MNYYYKGALVRTSKSHQYTHAAIRELNNGKLKVYGCSSTKIGAEKLLDRELSELHKALTFFSNLKNARINKAAIFWSNYHTRRGKLLSQHTSKYDSMYTDEEVDQMIERFNNAILSFQKSARVVELEQR